MTGMVKSAKGVHSENEQYHQTHQIQQQLKAGGGERKAK